MHNVENELLEALVDIDLFDAHTHLVSGRLGARGLHDILLYHMAVSDLYAAGCPTGSRLTPFPGEPSEDEVRSRIEEAIPFLGFVTATSTSWGIRIILRDLYDWDEPLSSSNWQRLHAMILERSNDRAWHYDVLRKAKITGSCTEFARRGTGEDDRFFCYSLEWGFFTRCQWGEFDTALYELERCWGEKPGSPSPIGAAGRVTPARLITSLSDVHEAMSWYLNQIPDEVVSVATHLSTDISYREVSDEEMREALVRRHVAGHSERDIYANYINELFLDGLSRLSRPPLFQFSIGAEPLPYETGSRLSQSTLGELAALISRHPRIRFQCFNACNHANQSLCTLCRELPNLSLAGYWWHNFYPSYIERIMKERIDMLPVNRQVGFFSDAYCVEWVFAKSMVIRRLLARALAEKISLGQLSKESALEFARVSLSNTAKRFYGLE